MAAPGQDRQNTQSLAAIASSTKEMVRALTAINDNLVAVGKTLKSWLDTAVEVEPVTELKVVPKNVDEENPQKRWLPLIAQGNTVGKAAVEMQGDEIKITDIRVNDPDVHQQLFHTDYSNLSFGEELHKTEPASPLNLSAADVDEIWGHKPPRADPTVWPEGKEGLDGPKQQ
jgi:hypothetical protein